MKTVIDGKEWILELLNANKPTISGKIYIDKRITTNTEDIVINSLTMTGQFMQNGVFNVNCYVPNLSVKQNDITISIPNRKRLKEISSQVVEVLKYHADPKYNLSIENIAQLEETNENANYINFRVSLNAFN
ncbi:hypothetical protein DSC47_09910 [Elizabethkingia miricola]|uniref:hypothetical protein n=2 Tax=Elizabethkingia TaxID=308865 RepID=UPI000999C2EB|nr:hypothetical protein [Elizabethkingia bruuniana]OPC66398.1 hypothetical protein BAY13_16805 [Elizabethkingia bruuniana]RBI91604.1 hypothetical protein DSC47_09910 [Elizabethkingia miricola]